MSRPWRGVWRRQPDVKVRMKAHNGLHHSLSYHDLPVHVGQPLFLGGIPYIVSNLVPSIERGVDYLAILTPDDSALDRLPKL